MPSWWSWRTFEGNPGSSKELSVRCEGHGLTFQQAVGSYREVPKFFVFSVKESRQALHCSRADYLKDAGTAATIFYLADMLTPRCAAGSLWCGGGLGILFLFFFFLPPP